MSHASQIVYGDTDALIVRLRDALRAATLTNRSQTVHDLLAAADRIGASPEAASADAPVLARVAALTETLREYVRTHSAQPLDSYGATFAACDCALCDDGRALLAGTEPSSGGDAR